MEEKKVSLGQAIDGIISLLEPLEVQTRKAAIEAVCSHLGLSNSNPIDDKVPRGGSVNRDIVDIKSFKEKKSPRSAAQMACVVAFYLQELAPASESKQSVNSADLTKYFKQAGFKLPRTITQLLPDCKARGYLDSGSVKGEYSLNAVGYNLVAHNLPTNSEKYGKHN